MDEISNTDMDKSVPAMTNINIQIQRNLSFIKDNITLVDSVIDKLIENDVIPLTERESIINNRTTKDQIQSIVDVVIKKNEGEVFIYALNDTKNHHVAERVLSTQTENDNQRSKTFVKNAETKETVDKILKDLSNKQLENQHLREQQKGLREKLEDKDRRIRELHRETFNKEAKCKQLEAEIDNLKKESKSVTTNQEEIIELRNEIEMLTTKLNEKDETLSNLDARLRDVQGEIGQYKDLTKKLISDNALLKNDNEQLKRENKEIKNICENISNNISMMMKNPRYSGQPWRSGTSTSRHSYTTKFKNKKRF